MNLLFMKCYWPKKNLSFVMLPVRIILQRNFWRIPEVERVAEHSIDRLEKDRPSLYIMIVAATDPLMPKLTSR